MLPILSRGHKSSRSESSFLGAGLPFPTFIRLPSSSTSPRRILALLSGTLTTLFILFYISKRPTQPLVIKEDLGWLADRKLATDPTPQSPTLHGHLEAFAQSLELAYAAHPVMKERKHEDTVFPATLTDAQLERYAHLRSPESKSKWMFTSVLFNVAHIAPDMFTALLVATDFLGPERVGFSIVEGPSNDGTDELLETIFRPALLKMGVDPLDIHLSTRRPKIIFSEGNRIELLAQLREEAILPLRRQLPGRRPYEAVVFFNDVYFSGAMLLELIHQHVIQGADMTSAWDLLWGNDYFYDVWVGRDIEKGDLFQPMPDHWQPSAETFPTAPISRARYLARLPLQVYSSWNGISILSASALLSPDPIHFRRSKVSQGECAAAEVLLLCKDFWKKGRGKIQVVPGVRVAALPALRQSAQEDPLLAMAGEKRCWRGELECVEDGPLGGPYRWMMILQCERATQVFDSVHLYTFCAGRCVPAAAQLSDLRSVPKASGSICCQWCLTGRPCPPQDAGEGKVLSQTLSLLITPPSFSAAFLLSLLQSSPLLLRLRGR